MQDELFPLSYTNSTTLHHVGKNEVGSEELKYLTNYFE
jgi:hypothetical protein